jgi:hypothetical protein
MTYFHKSFTLKEKKLTKKRKKNNKLSNLWAIHQCLQIDVGKILKTIQFYHNNFSFFNYKIYPSFMLFKV